MRSVLTLIFLLLSFIPSSPEQPNPTNLISTVEGPSKRRDPSHRVLQECSFDTGTVFLMSSTTPDGDWGWLLCVNPTSKHSWLYRVPWMIELYPEQTQSNVSLTLTSKQLSDGGKYTFEGEINEHELKGSLIVQYPMATPNSHTYLVKGFRLNPPASKGTRFPSGRYSNSRYLEVSGDPVGAELVLFLTPQQNTGLMKFNESYWGEPVFVPLALSNIRVISNQKLEFELKLGDEGTGKYSATRHGDAVIVRRLDVASVQGSQFNLRKKRSLLPQKSFD